MNKILTPQIAAMYIGQEATIVSMENRRYLSVGESYIDILKLSHVELLEGGRVLVKPHLRRLDSITEEEAQDIYALYFKKTFPANYPIFAKAWFENRFISNFEFPPAVFVYVLSKGFDLFGLIDAGEAIDINANQEIP